MNKDYFGYIKVNRNGRYRGILASLHDTGEADGDRLLQTQYESEISEDLGQLQKELKEQCDDNDIPYSIEPIRVTMMGVWESEFKKHLDQAS